MLKRALVQLLTTALHRLQPPAPVPQAEPATPRQRPNFRLVHGRATPWPDTRPDRAQQLRRLAQEVERWPLQSIASATPQPTRSKPPWIRRT